MFSLAAVQETVCKATGATSSSKWGPPQCACATSISTTLLIACLRHICREWFVCRLQMAGAAKVIEGAKATGTRGTHSWQCGEDIAWDWQASTVSYPPSDTLRQLSSVCCMRYAIRRLSHFTHQPNVPVWCWQVWCLSLSEDNGHYNIHFSHSFPDAVVDSCSEALGMCRFVPHFPKTDAWDFITSAIVDNVHVYSTGNQLPCGERELQGDFRLPEKFHQSAVLDVQWMAKGPSLFLTLFLCLSNANADRTSENFRLFGKQTGRAVTKEKLWKHWWTRLQYDCVCVWCSQTHWAHGLIEHRPTPACSNTTWRPAASYSSTNVLHAASISS